MLCPTPFPPSQRQLSLPTSGARLGLASLLLLDFSRMGHCVSGPSSKWSMHGSENVPLTGMEFFLTSSYPATSTPHPQPWRTPWRTHWASLPTPESGTGEAVHVMLLFHGFCLAHLPGAMFVMGPSTAGGWFPFLGRPKTFELFASCHRFHRSPPKPTTSLESFIFFSFFIYID